MDSDRSREHEVKSETQKEEDRAFELERECQGRQREEKREQEKIDEAPSAENLGPNCITPSMSNLSISVSNVCNERCIILNNVFDGTVERPEEFYLRVRNDLHRNSASCGPTHHIYVDKSYGRVYMLFDSVRTANKAAEKWHQSSYKGNLITISFSNTMEYKTRFETEI